MKRHVIKKYAEGEVQLHAFLTSSLDENDQAASSPDHFIPREKAPGTQ
jgi:hypothetical protein